MTYFTAFLLFLDPSIDEKERERDGNRKKMIYKWNGY